MSNKTVEISEYKAGEYERQFEYRSFNPTPIHRQWIISDPAIQFKLDGANRLLGELNAFSQILPDVDFFIKMHIAKEAATSSRIEGTQTNIEEALIKVQNIEPEKRDDWQEVQNYILAMNHAIEAMEKLPFSTRLLKGAHHTLMQGVRGKHKQPGEFRKSQNWIGISLKEASFVPPHHERVVDLMSDLENFIHDEEFPVPHLVKIAMAHYQFETIHPFLDGNGRLGRMMITLYLVSFNLLTKPSLYLSDFFERYKGEYYDQLMAVRTTNSMQSWLLFFLEGVIETAAGSIQVFKDILTIKEKIEREKMPRLHVRKQKNADTLMLQLYQNPITTINELRDLLGVGHNTAAALIKDFEDLGILEQLSDYKRNRLFIFKAYVKLFMG